MAPLPKKILSKMNKREITKYERLRKEEAKLFDYMDKVQRASTQYSRKIRGRRFSFEPTAVQTKKEQRTEDAGLRAMYFAHKKGDELREFTDIMRKKHGSTAMSSQERLNRKLITIYTRSSKTIKERIEKLKVRVAEYKREGKTELYEKYKKKLNSSKESLKRRLNLVKKLKAKYSS
ncbi:MAG: hypothetical protein CL494_07405 [Actinobacteria bacterium]|nr:hypothetical protein [Actinomycetota bacterium]